MMITISIDYKEYLSKLLDQTNNPSKLPDEAMFDLLVLIKNIFLKDLADSDKNFDNIIIPIPSYDKKFGYYNSTMFRSIRLFMVPFGYGATRNDDSMVECDDFGDRWLCEFKKLPSTTPLSYNIADITIQYAMLSFYSEYIFNAIGSSIYIANDLNIEYEECEFELKINAISLTSICSEWSINCYFNEKDIYNIIEKVVISLTKTTPYFVNYSYDHSTGRICYGIINKEKALEKQNEDEKKKKEEIENHNKLYDNDYVLLRDRFWIIEEILNMAKYIDEKRLIYNFYEFSDDNKIGDLNYAKELIKPVTTGYSPNFLFEVFERLKSTDELSRICKAYDIHVYAYDCSMASNIRGKRLSGIRLTVEATKESMGIEEPPTELANNGGEENA